jgi:hypothetical protein
VGLIATPLSAQARYRAAQLECTGFEERVRTDIRTETGARVRQETAGRAGIWRFRAHPVDSAIAVEGWNDSLAVWRESAEGRIQPDTDGLLGGRFRGRLSTLGAYQAEARPFVPDDVAEVADLSRALDDLFPPLPPSALAPGERWSNSTGLEIRRLPDSLVRGRPLLRFEVSLRRREHGPVQQADSLPLDLTQLISERGMVVWDVSAGLIRRERRLSIETDIRPGGPVRQALRSRVEQTITLSRRSRTAVPAGCDAKT